MKGNKKLKKNPNKCELFLKKYVVLEFIMRF